MWKFLPILLSILACSSSFLVAEPDDELLTSYKQTRARLTPEQEEFLMELLAADDALIAATTTRGIVDDVLQALAGIGQGNLAVGNVRVNLIGGSNPIPNPPPAPIPSFLNPTISFGPSVQQQQPAPQPQAAAPQQAAPPQVAPPQAAPQQAVPQQAAPEAMIAQLSNEIRQAMINAAPIQMMDIVAPALATGAPIPGIPADIPAPQQAAPQQAAPQQAAPQQVAPQQAQGGGNITTIGGDNNHLFSTISQVIRNSGTRNVTGIVDQSLRIATPAPIREFVTGILQAVYCNGIRRLLGRC